MQADASTTKRSRGTGLGLSIFKHPVEPVWGSIGGVSESGKGPEFGSMMPPPVAGIQHNPESPHRSLQPVQ